MSPKRACSLKQDRYCRSDYHSGPLLKFTVFLIRRPFSAYSSRREPFNSILLMPNKPQQPVKGTWRRQQWPVYHLMITAVIISLYVSTTISANINTNCYSCSDECFFIFVFFLQVVRPHVWLTSCESADNFFLNQYLAIQIYVTKFWDFSFWNFFLQPSKMEFKEIPFQVLKALKMNS